MKKIVLTCFSALTIWFSQAQDVHFSQWTQSPLTLSPALTGLTPCTYRACLNFRNQWYSVVGPSSYQTFAGSFDAGLWRQKLHQSMVGVGVQLYNDVSGDGALDNFTAMLSLAYHQNLGKGNHYLSVGVQGGYVQKRVDLTKLIFPDQIGVNGADPTLPSGEYGLNNLSYFDFNAGFNWRSRFTDHFAVQFGGAYDHLTEPQESFYSNSTSLINARYVGYGSIKIGFGKSVVLIPSGLYMQQTEGTNTEIVAGTSVGFQLEKGISMLYLGAHYRNDDAVISSVGFDYNNINFGLSYDINTSPLQTASQNRGGLELSLVYWGCIQFTPKQSPIDCPKFQ